MGLCKMKNRVMLLVLLSVFACKTQRDPARYVNPFIGTDFHGHTFPGAVTPFGMVQLSPDTRLTGWDGCSGYHYSDSSIYGFSHTHLSGTGASDYGDVLIMPVAAGDQFDNRAYASPFQKKNEQAQAGYYSVFLDKPKVLAELSATARVGLHRYTFPGKAPARILLDLEHRDQVLDSWIQVISPTEIHGFRRSKRWAKDQHLYFVMQFSAPFVSLSTPDPQDQGKKLIAGTKVKAVFEFAPLQQPLLIKVALSGVDPKGAKGNLDLEAPGWDFNAVRKAALRQWREELGKIEVSGGSREQLTTFYTALYHCFIHPSVWSDVDGRYRGHDNRIHQTDGYDQYTVFSLWDTFRTLHPLLNLIDTRRSRDFIRSFLAIYRDGGLLPVWELSANETFCMIGYHSVPVILDAWVKGIRDFDAELALEAMKHSAEQDHFGLSAYRRYGHIAGDKEHEGVSKTLEYAYDDWCIARFAGMLGKQADHDHYLERALYYRNLFDPHTGFMRPRINGNWKSPFDPREVDNHFTEANSWQYSFFVPHDISGLIDLFDGKEKMEKKLDELFRSESRLSGREQVDITGLIGQYAHGNEPSHHMAYLYNYLGKPWKTQQTVRRIMDTLYSAAPDGLCGNEDCGQMSAWLVMSAIGLYPVTPGLPEYAIGTPWFKKAVILLENGRSFVVNAPEMSQNKIHIHRAELNNKPYTMSYLHHDAITAGGRLDLVMSTKADPHWGTAEQDQPVSAVNSERLPPIPLIQSAGPSFTGQTEVTIEALQKGTGLFYTLDGSQPDNSSTPYLQPITLNKSTLVKAVSCSGDGRSSKVAEALFHCVPDNWTVQVQSKAHDQYSAGGPHALIDGLRGQENFRLGGWLGYQGQDFTAVVDLGESRRIQRLAAGFCQHADSWIMMPRSVDFWTSENGRDFRHAGTVRHHVSENNLSPNRVDMELKTRARARYVKVTAKAFGPLPQWHAGAGQPSYIFVDEIMID